MAALAFVLGAVAAAWASAQGARAAQGNPISTVSAPRFESLKSDRVTLHNGPGREFPISWVLTRIGLPVEVLRESDGWRQVRDVDGTTGWVPATVLSARRTALVVTANARRSKADAQKVDLRQAASVTAAVRTSLDAGAVVFASACDGTWCQVVFDGVRGYVAQGNLWGVYQGERLR